MRQKNASSEVEGNTITLAWEGRLQKVETKIEVLESGECIRSHTFVLDRRALVADTGFAVDQWYEDAEILIPDPKTLAAASKPDTTAIANAEVGATIIVKGTNGISAIRSLDGYAKTPGAGKRTHTNVSSPRTLVPFVLADLPAGRHTLVDKFAVSPSAAADFVERFTR